MSRETVRLSKTRGAAGLLVAVIGILVMLAVPPSMRSWSEGDAGFATAPATATEMLVASSPDVHEPARPFHAVAEPASPAAWSSGAIGMTLLAAFSLLLVILALVLRSAEAHGRKR